MENTKWYTSKRFWAGLITLLTGITFIITGEKGINEVLPELVMTAFGLVQFIIAVVSGKPVDFGGKTLFGKSLE